MQSAEELIYALEETKGLACLTLAEQVAIVRARDREIVKTLKPYTRHSSDCAKWGGLSVINPVECTCGLDFVLLDLD